MSITDAERQQPIVATIADCLVPTDALTANDADTRHPDHYVVHTENVEYLIRTVFDLASAPLGWASPGTVNSAKHLIGSCVEGLQNMASSTRESRHD